MGSSMESINRIEIVLDDWVRGILVDPISKESLHQVNQLSFQSSCGFIYHFKGSVLDLRVNLTDQRKEWTFGQSEFERWFQDYLNQGESAPNFYKHEIERDEPVYQKFSISKKGRVLDVGGQLGHIRRYLDVNQEYCSIDPFIGAHLFAINKKRLFQSYPLSRPINFIAGYAEYLPFQKMSFDLVNMRSCLDHFFSPEQALLEAYRVIKPGGHLIIGMTIEGQSINSKVKEFIRPIAGVFFSKFKDHHMWHPTYENLNFLTKECGFRLIEEYWQSKNIIYSLFERNPTLEVSSSVASNYRE
jgi:ubiquinone/menaquinone biosynthesis C-methylase UbiE